MKINSINQLIEHHVQDLFSAENQLVKALLELNEHAASQKLKQALQNHLDETEEHIDRIKEVANILDVDPNGEECVGIKGIINEGKKTLALIEASSIKDAAIIGGCQKAEHYEMAVYEDLILLLDMLGKNEAIEVLIETLNEEKAASRKLSDVAKENMELK